MYPALFSLEDRQNLGEEDSIRKEGRRKTRVEGLGEGYGNSLREENTGTDADSRLGYEILRARNGYRDLGEKECMSCTDLLLTSCDD